MKTLLATAAAAIAAAGLAHADGAKTAPVLMTEAEMDTVVAGDFYVDTPNNFLGADVNGNAFVAPNKTAVNRGTPAGTVCVSIGGSFACD